MKDSTQLLARALELHRQGQLGPAEALYREVLAAAPGQPEAGLNLAIVLQQQGRLAEALECYDRAVTLQPKSAEAHYNRGNVLRNLGRLREAVASYDQALALRPAFAEALNNRGNALQGLDRLDEALASYDGALVIRPDHPDTLNSRGAALQRLHRLDPALASFDRALALRPAYPEARFNRGIVLQELKRAADALASYDAALALKPEYPEAWNNRANTLQGLERWEDALASCDRALTLRPDYPDAWNNRSIILQSLNRPEEALASCDRALALRPDFALALNNRGIALRKLQRIDEAIETFRQALVAQPDTADFHANLGVALLELGQLELAEASLRQALPAKTGQAFQGLASVLYQMGRIGEATEIYQQWLAHEPDNPIAQHMTAIGSEAVPDRCSDAYVTSLFDRSFAENFDNVLLGLGYQVPQLLTALLHTELGTQTAALRILDAGCGTGLSAPLLRPLASQLVGVDLAAAMVSKARDRQLYDELAVGELCAFMAARPNAYDVIVLADVLVYFGDLEEAFRTAFAALAPGGVIALAVEARPADDLGPDYRLESHGRYSHRPDYVTAQLLAAGYALRTQEPIVIRRESNADVTGSAVVARRPASRVAS